MLCLSSLKNKVILSTAIIAALLFSGCEKAFNLKEPSQSKAALFNELWNVLDKQYALFTIKNADWKLVYQQFNNQVNEAMTDQAFFNLVSQMMDSLKDGHVSLTTPVGVYVYEGFYKPFPANFNYNNVVNTYIGNNLKTTGAISYTVVNNVGYIYYSSFYNTISDSQLDTIFTAMTATSGLMVDIRSNTGGSSVNVDKLFARFISQKRLVKYEKFKKGPGYDDFYEAEPFYAQPNVGQYTKPVALLTNRTCFSACNDFALYMSYLPNVKIFGDQTGGGGSIPSNYILANGWKLQYSSTITLSPDKAPVENGILPDEFVFITPADEANGKDPVIEKAFLYLR